MKGREKKKGREMKGGRRPGRTEVKKKGRPRWVRVAGENGEKRRGRKRAIIDQ